MESSHDFGAFDRLRPGTLPGSGSPVACGPAIDDALIEELLASPDAPRELLVAALKEERRRFNSLLSSVSGSFYRCELGPPQSLHFFRTSNAQTNETDCHRFEETRFRELIDPEDLLGFDTAVERAIAEHKPFLTHFRVENTEGETRWKNAQGKCIYTEDGRPLAVEGFVTDVTERKVLKLETEAAHESVRKLNSKLTRMLEATLDCVMCFDRNYSLTFANSRARAEIGRNGFPGWKGNLAEFEPLRSTFFWQVLSDAMDRRKPGRAEGFMPQLDVWFDLYVVPDEDGITVFFRNVSDRRQMEQELQSRAETLQNTLDSIPDMVWSARPDGRGEYFNRSWNEFIGRPPEDLKAIRRRPTSDWMHPDDIGPAMSHWANCLAAGKRFETELRMAHHSGEFRWVLARAWPQFDENGAIAKWFGSATDIHDRVTTGQKLREAEILQGSILDSTPDHILILDLDGKVLSLNAPAQREPGLLEPSILVGKAWMEFWPQKCRRAVRRAIGTAREGEVARFDGNCLTSIGDMRWWDNIVSPIRDADGEVRRLLCITRDITPFKATVERLRQASEQDFLTSLPNRRAFKRYLKQTVGKAQQHGSEVGLMLLDLDHFKHVNDMLGHLAGDHMLRVIARRLASCVGDQGFVARLDGDEFAIVIAGMTDEMELVRAATQVLTHLEAPITYQGKPISGGMSIGCAMYPRDAIDAHGLLKHADMALYDLKASGRGGIQMFDAELKEAVERTANQLTVARRVIHDSAVEPYYQPKVRLDTREVAGFEALLRWWCPGNGIQLPGTVAEAFNDYELSSRIGTLMQTRVFADMAGWLEAGHNVLPVSINASPAEFMRDDYAERLLRRIGEFGFSPSLVEVEITEHVFLERRTQQVVRALGMLKDAGVKIALDDFGTGHSSLSHLRDFPVDVLKLDRSFVSRMLSKPSILAIVKAILELGPSLQLEVVAEGIETPEQFEVLRGFGCTYGQGYLFGKAMSAQDAASWLTSAQWPLSAKPRKTTRSNAA